MTVNGVSAKLRYARLSAQKARLVADLVRGLPIERVLDQLTFSTKKGAMLIKKISGVSSSEC